MDEALRKSGDYPNIALTPGTHRHAATGETVEIPASARVDGDAYMTLTPDDAEYPEGFLLDVFHGRHGGIDDGWGAWLYSFIVPCCPMCGRELGGDAE